jgi:FkbM family methyltransferase
MQAMGYLINKTKRKIINICLKFIQAHLEKQEDLFVYVYDRRLDSLKPITWSARGITQAAGKSATNDWDNLSTLVNYKNKVVVDVGASLGLTVFEFSDLASEIHAFEPHKENYKHLLDQIKIRKINNVKTYQKAVSDSNGQIDFFSRESHGIHSLGAHNKGKVLDSYKVESITLDSFWESEINTQIGLLKVDVEGFENEVFIGARDLLKQKKIDAILFEFSPKIHKIRGIDIYSPITTLNNFDYDVFYTDGRPFDFNDSLPKICDLIAKPR